MTKYVNTKKQRQTQPTNINNNININKSSGNINVDNSNNNINITNNINIFHIPNNNQPVRGQHNNRYVGTESGNMNNDELIKFSEDIIVENTQDQPAALGYRHNKHNITVCRIPPNSTAWLQPCDIVLFGPAKQMVRHQHKLDRQLGT